MATILLAIPSGVAVRDILRSGNFEKMAARGGLALVVLVPEGDIQRLAAEFARPNVYFEPLGAYVASTSERLLYHLNRGFLYHKSPTVRLGNVVGMNWSLRLASLIARIVRSFMSDDQIVSAMAWCFRNLTAATEYADIYAKYKPDLVVVSRVLNFSRDFPVMKRAQVEGVPVVVLVSSWDNLTSKGFYPFDAYKLVVWNGVMKEEAVSLFHYPPGRVLVSGIPRYDLLFGGGALKTRSAFFQANNLIENKKLITYATGSATTGLSAEDPVSPEAEICEYIADAIATGRIPDSQLLVRLHPQADPAQYTTLFSRPDVVVDVPGKESSFVDRLFTRDDDCSFFRNDEAQ